MKFVIAFHPTFSNIFIRSIERFKLIKQDRTMYAVHPVYTIYYLPFWADRR